jgi:ABC-2 type transport system ATP-binding protein
MTIFLTTHYLDEADHEAERVMVIDNGTMIADDTPARLKARLAGDRISIMLTSDSEAAGAAEMATKLPAARDVSRRGERVEVTVEEGEALLPELIRRLHEAGSQVAAASVRRPTLDDVFLGLTGRTLREAEQ